MKHTTLKIILASFLLLTVGCAPVKSYSTSNPPTYSSPTQPSKIERAISRYEHATQKCYTDNGTTKRSFSTVPRENIEKVAICMVGARNDTLYPTLAAHGFNLATARENDQKILQLASSRRTGDISKAEFEQAVKLVADDTMDSLLIQEAAAQTNSANLQSHSNSPSSLCNNQLYITGLLLQAASGNPNDPQWQFANSQLNNCSLSENSVRPSNPKPSYTYKPLGTMIQRNDGVTYHRLGDNLIQGSDGSQCTRLGDTWTCN